MNEFVLVIVIALVMAIPVFVAGLAAERVTVPPVVISAAWQVAAGMLVAIIGFSLMPPVVRDGLPMLVMLAIFAGGALFVLVDYLVTRRQPAGPTGSQAPSAGLFIGVLVDLAIDGILIGVGSTVALSTGLLLALGMAVSSAPLAFVSIATARSQGLPPVTRRQYSILFGAAVLVGAALGFLVFRNQPEEVKNLLIAAASGFLITLVTQTMVPEAIRDNGARFSGVFFIAGLSVYALMTLTIM
ncbi:MAG: hypothetical protein IT340_14390 [Chloroflexi bacterium]|nr:hypothetical protein [Chloroflexota bacterium]